MSVKGKRARIVSKPKPKVSAPTQVATKRVGDVTWHLNDSVYVTRLHGKTPQQDSGQIVALLPHTAMIQWDTEGDEDSSIDYVHLRSVDDPGTEPPEVQAIVDGEDDDDSFEVDKSGGFSQFGIKWDKSNVNFKADTDEGIHFYGWWRRTEMRGSSQNIYAIDLFAQRTIKDGSKDGKQVEFTVESITYTDTDPRKNMKSLNADICAAMNQWFHRNLHDDAENLDKLYKQAKHPTLYLTRIGSMDALIMRLREFRETAIRCGGSRLFEFSGDKPGPAVHIVVNVTDQAIMLEGKVPRIKSGHGSIIDHAAETKGKDPERVRIVQSAPIEGNVKSLVERLQSTKDPSEARKLRAVLRKMGHRGGQRAAK